MLSLHELTLSPATVSIPQIALAAKDLLQDCTHILGTVPNGTKPVTITTDPTLSTQPEAFRIVVNHAGVSITGSDLLGTIYGIYTFSERCLHTDPCYRFSGILPERNPQFTLADTVITDFPKSFRFRGWFLNDEDLLTSFVHSGLARHLDYAFYQEVTDVSVLDMILETALRLKINLIIPASFLDILEPNEETLVKAVARRGLYITQHHIEPMGISYFTMEKRLGKDFIYTRDKEKVEALWEASARKWASYGNVIWQLGLRGRGDIPIWATDPGAGNTPQARGALISEAIATQYRILQKIYGEKPFLSTSTLWLEGAALYDAGTLILPEKTIPVFADVGGNQMLAEDFFSVKRKAGCHYGIYSHAAFWSHGPHLAEGCCVEKMEYNYRNALQSGGMCYSILNVANLREFLLSATANAALTWDAEDFSAKDFLRDYYTRRYGEDLSFLYHAYFAAMADAGFAELSFYCGKVFHLHRYQTLPFAEYLFTDSTTKEYILSIYKDPVGAFSRPLPPAEAASRFARSARAMDALVQQILALLPRLRNASALRTSLLWQAILMRGFYRYAANAAQALVLASDGAISESKQCMKDGVTALEELCQLRQMEAEGDFANWWNGDEKINLVKMCQKAESIWQNAVQILQDR